MNKQWLLAALLAALGSTSVQAADTGLYIGGSFGQSKINNFSGADIDSELAADYAITSSTSTDDTDTGWKVFAGYQFMKYLAVEGAYVNSGKFKANSVVTVPSAGVVNTEIETDAWTLSALGILPLGDNFSLFGRVGINFWNADITATGTGGGGTATYSESDDGTDWVYGVGAAYQLTDNFSVRGEWERYDYGDGDADLLSAGVAWRF